MIKIKPIVVLSILLCAVAIIIPSVLVLPFTEEKVSGKLKEKTVLEKKTEHPKVKTAAASVEVSVPVFRSVQKQVENVPLESYVVGVVASEMSAEFELEALKAQSLAARTYIVNKIMNGEKSELSAGALVSDTVMDQVYKNDAELRRSWGKDYDWKIKIITEAVQSTRGLILTYKGVPITAAFFSTSNGYTENSEDYWPNAYPYLRSTVSPWDQVSPKFNDEKTFSIPDFEQSLGIKLADKSDLGKVINRTTGKRVGKVEIGGKTFTGKEIREKLNLKSSDFTWARKGDQIIVTTKGYGHGVGMSQYGANGMAKDGKKYTEILKHYYKDIEITEWKNNKK